MGVCAGDVVYFTQQHIRHFEVLVTAAQLGVESLREADLRVAIRSRSFILKLKLSPESHIEV